MYCTDGVYKRDESISDQTRAIIIDESCTKLSVNAFQLSFLEQIRLPDTLIEIEDDAFVNSKIKTLFIPKSTTILSFVNPFNFMPYLERIDVDPNNPNYSSNNGILFSKNFDQLIHYPMHITSPLYVVPRSVRFINPYCFFQHEFIETVIFHDKILELRECCFCDCRSLKTIMIPNKFELPKNLTGSFLYSTFRFPDNVLFYFDIFKTCGFLKNQFDFHLIIASIFLIIS